MKQATIEAIIDGGKELGRQEAFARTIEFLDMALRNASSDDAKYMLGLVRHQIERERGESK